MFESTYLEEAHAAPSRHRVRPGHADVARVAPLRAACYLTRPDERIGQLKTPALDRTLVGTPARIDIEFDLSPTQEDVATVRAGLMAFNDSFAGPSHLQRLAVYLRDETRTIRGGLVGYFAWGWLAVDLLWIDEPLRGQGYGSALLDRAEAMAREAQCVAVRLDTYEFQARPFYERRGYVVFGVLDGYPADTRTYYLRKTL